MTQWVKNLLCKHENLSSDPWDPGKVSPNSHQESQHDHGEMGDSGMRIPRGSWSSSLGTGSSEEAPASNKLGLTSMLSSDRTPPTQIYTCTQKHLKKIGQYQWGIRTMLVLEICVEVAALDLFFSYKFRSEYER